MRRAAILGILTSVGLTGCMTGEPADTEAGLAQGITVLRAEVGRLSLAYRDGNDVIYMEAARGAEVNEVYRGVPDMPDFEIDVRFVDDRGYAFHTRRGGDAWIERDWAEALERQVRAPAPEGSNERQWQMSGDAAGLISGAVEQHLGPDAALLAPEVRALLDFATMAREAYAARVDRTMTNPSIPQVFGDDGDVAFGTNGPEDPYWWQFSGNYVWEMDVHRSNIAGDGYHSAVAVWGRSGTQWYYFHSSCNHGGCANTISFNCTLATSAVNNLTWVFETCIGPYSWTSNDNGHNCHDDTRVQLRNMALGQRGYGTARWCSNGDHRTDISHWPGDQGGSPSCNSDSNRGYGY